MNRSTREFWVLSAAVVLSFSVLLSWAGGYFRAEFAQLGAEQFLTSNLVFFLLINLNIILVTVLAFLVVKNIIKLILDRRRQILGSKLRSRLVLAFVGLALIPTILLFLVSRRIVSSALQLWFSPQVAASVEGALSVARYHYNSSEQDVYRAVRYLGLRTADLAPYLLQSDTLDSAQKGVLETFFKDKLEEYGLFEIALVDAKGEALVRVVSSGEREGRVAPPNLQSVKDALAGSIIVRPEQLLSEEALRGYAPIAIHPLGGLVGGAVLQRSPEQQGVPADYCLLVTHWVGSELGEVLSNIVKIYDDFNEQKSFRIPLASSYLLTLVIVTLMIVFAAIWVGFYLARSLSVPILQIAEGTQAVARGDLSFKIPDVGGDELGMLAVSFNKMTDDLKHTTDELVERRRYMETVLESVGVGVFSFTPQLCLATLNAAAAEMLSLPAGETLIGRQLADVLPSPLTLKLREMLGELDDGSGKVTTATLSVYVGDQTRHIQITASRLERENGEALGTVVLLDDLTELVSAQRMAAWQEVARRMAHEIKNPLTPIQLSAQRIQRRITGEDGEELAMSDRALILECADTVVSQVEMLRTLVNEFSRFARLPRCSPVALDLNSVIRESAALFRGANSEIELALQLQEDLPVIEADKEQMSRVFVNLFDNAATSIRAKRTSGGAGDAPGQIRVRTTADQQLGLVIVTVSDNGLGISDSDKPKLFEPYFSTKKGGTGLGLAIVSSILADHNGFVRVRDNQPSGATFLIELPLRRSEVLRA